MFFNLNSYRSDVLSRVANRIGEGKFTLDGKEYQLAKVRIAICSYLTNVVFTRTMVPMPCTVGWWGWTR